MSYGRRVIYSDATAITAENVADEVRKAYLVHGANQAEIKKLHEIYRGKTDILSKVKEVRESINHKITENRAYEIVNFYNGYLFGEPVQYVRRENVKNNGDDDAIASCQPAQRCDEPHTCGRCRGSRSGAGSHSRSTQ